MIHPVVQPTDDVYPTPCYSLHNPCRLCNAHGDVTCLSVLLIVSYNEPIESAELLWNGGDRLWPYCRQRVCLPSFNDRQDIRTLVLLTNFRLWFFSSAYVDNCASSPCRNGGTCIDGANEYTCVCVAGYAGASCESEHLQFLRVATDTT